ncbi:MAG TPA: penicillin-binding protein 2 [Vicinamibacterales bacterium]|nr:penicillin-binding protein 2 [Vicinamibacterales bacterium]
MTGTDDRRHIGIRLAVFQYSIACVFAALAVGFWVFQVVQYAEFKEIADSQYMQRVPLPAPRGVLVDRNGVVLVENQHSLNIVLMRERVKDLDATLRTLAEATGTDLEQLQEAVNRRRREPTYRPIVLIANASLAQVAAVEARSLELPGIERQPVPARRYRDERAGHLFGYVGEVSEAQLARADYKDLGPGAIIGQAGIEQAYNRLLMGIEGNKDVIVNSRGREILEVGYSEAKEGTRLQLTIDADLQAAAADAFRHVDTNGAAVVLDPRSGEVLSLLSLPSYDPNDFAVRIAPAVWRSLVSDRLKPLNNRALQGTYSPGSTFKIVVAAAAMEEGVAGPNFRTHCSGGATFYGRYFQCWKKGGHGTVDMRRAMEQSCNVYFYTLGNMLGVDRIHKWATAMGLGVPSGIELPNEATGLVPSTEWKMRTQKDKWYAGETISVAIGQGQVNVTPMQLAVMAMTAANGGTRYTPHLLKAIDEGQGWKPVPPPAPKSVVHMEESTLKALRDGLWLVVNGAGTARGALLPGRDVSGKTGTAQVISLSKADAARGKMDVRHHRWFVFFAPRDNPEIAGVVFAEHAGSESKAVPIARHVIETYFAKKEGRPLPSLTPQPPSATILAEAEVPVPAARPGGDD